MDQNNSPIRSTSINLGHAVERPTTKSIPIRPWVILICSDLGFTSNKPEQVTAASWNDFLQTVKPSIAGVVRRVPSDVEPFFVEIPITSLKDLSVDSIVRNSRPFTSMASVLTILKNVIDGKTELSAAVDAVQLLNLPPAIKSQALSALETRSSGKNKSTPVQSASKIDCILSNLDLGGGDQDEKRNSSNDAADRFYAADAEADAISVSRSRVEPLIRRLSVLLDKAGDALSAEQFFTSRLGSYTALQQLLKAIGRNNGIGVFISSGDRENVLAGLDETIRTVGAELAVPDIIIWDFPVKISTAEINVLADVCSIAENRKCMVFSSIDTTDQAFASYNTTASFRELIATPEFIPLTRFRKNAQTRNAALIGPEAVLGIGREIKAGGAWAAGIFWVKNVLDYKKPFSFDDLPPAAGQMDCSLSIDFSKDISEDAGKCGIALLRMKNGILFTGPVNTMLDISETDESYGLFGFNLLVNRTVRLTAEWLSSDGKQNDRTVNELQQFLIRQLEPYRILSSDNELSIEQSETGAVTVTIHSDQTLSGCAVRFQFTLGE